MTSFLNTSYVSFIQDSSDARVKDWFLMGSLWKIILIQGTYLYVSKELGPKFMEKRKPFNIDKLLIGYNFAQMLVNAYIFYHVTRIVFTTFGLYCNAVDYSNSPNALVLLNMVYLYFITKIVDLLDTVFFIMRKKYNQISFLHLYHHCSMIIYVWAQCNFFGGGDSLFTPLINSFVHVCMYGYYLVTVWDKRAKNSMWWKKYITQLQVIQLLIGFFLTSSAILSKECEYPMKMLIPSLLQGTALFTLFAHFYLNAYIFPKNKETEKTS